MFSQYDDSLKSMHNRLFYVWIMLCFVANIIGTIFNYIATGWSYITWICFIVGVLMAIIVSIAVFLDKKYIASSVIFLLLTWIEFPIIYLAYGKVAMAYFLLSIFAGTIVFPLKRYFAFASSSVIWYGLVILYESLQEDIINIIYNEMTFLIAVIAIVLIQGSLLYYYERQKKELNEAKAEIEYRAIHDSLTGLYSRGYLMTDLDQRMNRRDDFVFALIDIDGFKGINDTYGHQIGDEVLSKLGKTILDNIGEQGYSARYGGEEIVIIFYLTDINVCKDILKTIRIVVNDYFKCEKGFGVTFSGGIEYSKSFDNATDLINCVDTKLYEAKKNGKDQII